MATIRLKAEALDRLTQQHGHGTQDQQAAATGLGLVTLWRARKGMPVGERVVASLLGTYGVPFEDLFEVVTDEDTGDKPVKVPA